MSYNINKKIQPLPRKLFPMYDQKIEEHTDAINWFLGMRTTNGQLISEEATGPVLNVGNQGLGSAEPWLTDPDGNTAGWQLENLMDISGAITGTPNTLFQMWIWCGRKPKNIVLCPWLVDPNGTPAQWVQWQVCENGTVVDKWFWGTP